MEALFDQSVPWYIDSVPPIPPATRDLIVKYAGIEDSDAAVQSHFASVRDKAWKTAPFPCVGSFLFADLALSTFSIYPTILSNLKSGKWTRYLEVGCGLGQDMRKLIQDGVSVSSVLGTDLLPGLLEAGQLLFRDAEAMPLGTSLLAADFLSQDESSPLVKLDGTVHVIHASMFLHCFNQPTQLLACARMVRLLKPTAGVTLVGRQGGVSGTGTGPREEEVKGPMGRLGGVVRTNYLHTPESFTAMWDEVGRLTDTRWDVQAVEEEVRDRGGLYFDAPDHRWLRFVVVRL